MKKLYLKPGGDFPYSGTDVPFEKSVEDVKKLLRKFGCEELLIYEAGETTTLYFKKDGVPYIVGFPLVYFEGRKTPAKPAMQVSGRIIHHEIKALLIGVEVGTISFMQAMLRYIALPSPAGIVALGDLVETQKDSIMIGKVEFDPQKVKALPRGES